MNREDQDRLVDELAHALRRGAGLLAAAWMGLFTYVLWPLMWLVIVGGTLSGVFLLGLKVAGLD